jgi:hypothetical protein
VSPKNSIYSVPMLLDSSSFPFPASTMPNSEEKKPSVESTIVKETSNDDDRELVALGYQPSFKREFTNLATV